MLPSPGFGLVCDAKVDDAKLLLPADFRPNFPRKADVFFLFKREEKDMNPTMIRFFKPGLLHSYCIPWNQWWRFPYFCLCSKSRSTWQSLYLPDRTMKDWHTKETFFPARVLVHVYSTSVFLFSKSHLPSECNQSP